MKSPAGPNKENARCGRPPLRSSLVPANEGGDETAAANGGFAEPDQEVAEMQFQVFDMARDHGATLRADAERARLVAEARAFGRRSRRTVGGASVTAAAGSKAAGSAGSAGRGVAGALASAAALVNSIGRRGESQAPEHHAAGHGAHCA